MIEICPFIRGMPDDQQLSIADEDELVDEGKALVHEPIVGVDKVVFDEATGSGGLAARPLPSPKGMTMKQREVHDLTHLPYGPSCEICVSCRRPNTQHRTVSKSERSVPLLVDNYVFQSTLMIWNH